MVGAVSSTSGAEYTTTVVSKHLLGITNCERDPLMYQVATSLGPHCVDKVQFRGFLQGIY